MISDKYYTEDEEYHIDEDKTRRGSSLRQETELFDEDDNVVHRLFNVKRIEVGKESCWEILENKKSILTLRGVRFSALERAFLDTPSGMRFIIEGAKNGWGSVSEFKRQIKRFMK